MKFIHQLLKNKRLLIHVKGQSIKQYFATKKEIQEHIEQLKKLMQRYSKKIQPM